MDAKRSQIEALNAADLSLEEYRWIRDQAYRAIGVAYVDLDIAKIVDEAKRGVTSQEAGTTAGRRRTRAGVEPNSAREVQTAAPAECGARLIRALISQHLLRPRAANGIANNNSECCRKKSQSRNILRRLRSAGFARFFSYFHL